MILLKNLHFTCKTITALFAVLLLFSCETTLTESDPLETISFDSQQRPTSLEAIEVTDTDGVPSFKDAEHFLAATELLSTLNDRELIHWYNSNNLSMYFEQYINANKIIENQPESISKEVLSKKDQELFILPRDGGVFIPTSFAPVSRVLGINKDFYIGNIYHKFSDGNHYAIVGDEATLNNLISTQAVPGENTYQIDKLQPDFDFDAELEKVQFESFSCPRIVASTNGNNNNNTSTSLTRMDEQKIGCNRNRCRQRTWGTYQATTFSNGNQVLVTVTHSFLNKRRSGGQWIRTFPDVFVTTSDGSFVGPLGLDSNCSTSGLSYATTQSQTFNGSAEGTMNVISRTESFVACTITQTFNRTMHTWTNRGNPNDPIQVGIGCQ